MESCFSLPSCYCCWGVSAPLSQDSPSTALSQLSGKCLPRDCHTAPVPAAEARSQRSCAGTKGRNILVQTHQGPAQTFKIPPQQSQICWQELQQSTTALVAALVARWNNDTILLHFPCPCAHTNICLLTPAGNAAHTIASLP